LYGLDGSNEGAPTPPSRDSKRDLRQDQAAGREISPVRFGRRHIREREASDEKRSRCSWRALPANVQAREEALGLFRSLRKPPLSINLDRTSATESRDRALLGRPLPIEAVARFGGFESREHIAARDLRLQRNPLWFACSPGSIQRSVCGGF
jgi:hypothetical protein